LLNVDYIVVVAGVLLHYSCHVNFLKLKTMHTTCAWADQCSPLWPIVVYWCMY